VSDTLVTEDYKYIGDELTLFSAATNWKSTLRRNLGPFIVGDVLEVGAGIGATMRALRTGRERSWTCVEPDPRLARELVEGLRSEPLNMEPPELVVGTIGQIEPGRTYDTLLYVDVIEHIEGDQEEIQRAVKLLGPGGQLVVLAPAHQYLFTPFDKSIGHFRRYDRKMMKALAPEGASLVRLWYLDSVGFFASLANRLLLSSAMPTARQIWVWDRLMVPLSRVIDPILMHRFGKSILAVWRKDG